MNFLKLLIYIAIYFISNVAHANSYPNRPIKFIVSYSVGGPADILARSIAEKLSVKIEQSVIVQNVLGAGGILGAETVFRSKPDGYTLYFTPNTISIFPHVRTNGSSMSFNILDFVAIGGFAKSANVLVASNQSGIKNLSDLINLAKQKNDSLTYGSSGIGSATHLSIAFFVKDANINLLHIPYKGAAPIMIDLLAGRIDLVAPGYTVALHNYITDNKVTALAVTSTKRLSLLPNVPTFIEQGYSNVIFPNWYGLFAPKNTSIEVVNKLSEALESITKDQNYVNEIARQGYIMEFSTSSELTQTLIEDTTSIGKKINDLNLQFNE